MSRSETVVLHLVASDTPAESWAVLHSIVAALVPGITQATIRVGHAGSGRQPTGDAAVVHAPLPVGWLRSLALRREVDKRAVLSASRVVIMHAWSLTAAEWCVPLAATNRPLVVQVEPGTNLRPLAAWSQRRTLTLVCESPVTRWRLTEAGVPRPRCLLIRPTLMDNMQVAPDRRAAVRQHLKLDEQHVVVTVLPPVSRQAGTFVAAWATLLLEKAHPAVRLVVPADGTEAERVRRLVVSCRHEQVVRFTAPEVPLRDVLAASDLAVYLPPQDAPSTGLVAAMAAGCPIVASSVPTVTELLVAGESAWLCRPGDPQDAARQLLQAIENMEQSRWQAEHARTLAATFSTARMLAEYARVYRNLATRRPASAA